MKIDSIAWAEWGSFGRPTEGRVCDGVDAGGTKKLSPVTGVCVILALFMGMSLPLTSAAQQENSLDIIVEFETDQTFAPGWILSAPRFSSNLTYPMVIDATGADRFNDLRPYEGFNFDHHEDGRLAWFSTFDGWWHVMDSSLAVAEIVDIEGPEMDFHDLELRADGTRLLLAQDFIDVNVADSVPDPSNPWRVVIDCIIHEVDEAGNLLWAWRATDHIPPTVCTHCNWQASLIDAYHHNAFQTLENGDLLVCFRNADMVVRIDKQTGEVVWQLGGPGSDFAFTDADGPFAQQHDAHWLEGDRILLFDNATGSQPLTSRGVEYQLDFDAGTATILATWPHPDGSFAGSQGSIQRLENGGTLIGWGTAGSEEHGGGMVSEYDASGALVGTIYFPANHWNYRARKVPEDQLPLRIGCRNPLACNFDPAAIVDGDCIVISQPCDDGNPCTVQDAITNQCECLGESLAGNPEEGQCLDPMAVNYDPCSVLTFDDGSCVYELEFRVDATGWQTVPDAVSVSWAGQPGLALQPGGFGTWTGSLLVGNGIWTVELMADGASDGLVREVDLTWPVSWDGEPIHFCLGEAAALCPGCQDPDDPRFSPFAGDNALCGQSVGVGCTEPEAVNFDASAFFDDGSCQFNPTNDCPQDLTGDGFVGVSDILDLLTYFGNLCD